MANSNAAFNIRNGYIAPATVEHAEQVLRETPEVSEAAVKELRELLKAATDLHYNDDDAFLIIWLRACHFYPQSALEKVRVTSVSYFLSMVERHHFLLIRGVVVDMRRVAVDMRSVFSVIRRGRNFCLYTYYMQIGISSSSRVAFGSFPFLFGVCC